MKELRAQLHLSRNMLLIILGISRATFTQMENGNRKVTAVMCLNSVYYLEYQQIRFCMDRNLVSQLLYSLAVLKV